MIHFTSSAIKILQNHLPKSPDAGFRLLITRNCASIQYTLRQEESSLPNDEIVEIGEGIKLFIYADTFPLVDNTTVDFVEERTQSGFTFDNPNVIIPNCSSCESTCQEAL